jgi:nucleoside-diphosphate-sugar epimerase
MTLYFKESFNYQSKYERKMNVLVTGNQGYIGSVLTEVLLDKGYRVTGLDTGYFTGIAKSKGKPGKQITKDIRKVVAEDLKGIDAIIHLAALSNDPLGEFDPSLTDNINYKATISLAKLAKKMGVKRFVYASSQSMYGISDTDEELDEDNSNKNAITAYAKTKWQAEQELKLLGSDEFVVSCFRPSTVFGASPKLRSDIVFNNLVACAFTTGNIEIKSDGTPWRPVVHVKDVCSAFIAGLEAPADLIANESFNVGIPNGNFTVRELAEAAQRAVPGSTLHFTGEHGKDARTYRVSFKKILTVLKDYFKPEWDLDRGGKELVELFKETGFAEKDFRGRKTNRLAQLKHLLDKNRLDKNLYWAE